MQRTEAFHAEDIILQANLREDHNGIERICNLQQGGKLTADECISCISDLTQRLLRSRETLITEA